MDMKAMLEMLERLQEAILKSRRVDRLLNAAAIIEARACAMGCSDEAESVRTAIELERLIEDAVSLETGK